MEPEIPHALLDLPTVEAHQAWPESFRYLGYALRIDYLTTIHSEDQTLESFYHDFASGVRVYEPDNGDVFDISTREGMLEEDRDKNFYLSPSVDPIVFGIVDRLILLTPESRQLVLAHPEVEVPAEEVAQAYFIIEMPDALLSWDPEGRQLLVTTFKGDPILVLREGALTLSDSGMILG